jgi:hypothetical protein
MFPTLILSMKHADKHSFACEVIFVNFVINNPLCTQLLCQPPHLTVDTSHVNQSSSFLCHLHQSAFIKTTNFAWCFQCLLLFSLCSILSHLGFRGVSSIIIPPVANSFHFLPLDLACVSPFSFYVFFSARALGSSSIVVFMHEYVSVFLSPLLHYTADFG